MASKWTCSTKKRKISEAHGKHKTGYLVMFGIINFFPQHEEEKKRPSTARNWEQESAFVDKYNYVAKMCKYCIL